MLQMHRSAVPGAAWAFHRLIHNLTHVFFPARAEERRLLFKPGSAPLIKIARRTQSKSARRCGSSRLVISAVPSSWTVRVSEESRRLRLKRAPVWRAKKKGGRNGKFVFAWCMNICGTCTQRALAEALLFLHRGVYISLPPPHSTFHPSPTLLPPVFQPEAFSVTVCALHITCSLKKKPAAFPWPFCPRSGRRLAHRGSCYNFHFLNIFLSFFPSLPAPLFFLSKDQEGYFIPFRRCDDDKWAEQDGSSDWGCCHSRVGRDTQCALLQGCCCWRMVRCGFGRRCGWGWVRHWVWVTWGICGPEVKWDNVSEEWRVYFIIILSDSTSWYCVCFWPLLSGQSAVFRELLH